MRFSILNFQFSISNVRLAVMFVALAALVYVCYAGKGTALPPGALLGVTVLTESEISKRLKRKQGESASSHLLRVKGVIAENARLIKEGVDANIAANREETDDQVVEFNNLTAEREAAIALHRMIELAAGEAGNIDGRYLSEDDREIPHHPLPGQGLIRTPGRAYAEAKEIVDWRKSGGGVVTGSPRVNVETFFPQRRDLVTAGSVTSAGALVLPATGREIEAFWQRPLTIRDLVTVGTTDGPNTSFVDEAFVNNAAEVAEATAVGDGSGAAPQSELTLSLVEETVKDLKHWIPVTVNALMDAGQVRSEIDSALLQGIEELVEDRILAKILAATGTGGINIQAFDTTILDTARKAITSVQRYGKTQPTAFAITPEIDEALDLTMNTMGTWYAAGAPFGVTPATLWGRARVVSLSSQLATYGILGDWKRFKLLDYLQSQIYAFEQHSDFAIRGIVALMGVYRAAMQLRRKPAFTRIAWA